MKLFVIVLNWNQREATLSCLESLYAAERYGAEFMLVDNGSRDGSVEAVRARYPELRIVALPQNLGYAGGNNAGIRAALDAGAEAVVLLNNDTRVAPDFLEALLWSLENPACGAVCAAIFRMDRPQVLDVAYGEVHFDQREAVKTLGVNALPGLGFDSRREVQVALGCCLGITARALRTVGLFDEAYFAYHEEVDWCLRARKAGFQLFYEPFARVFHAGSASTKALHAPPQGDAPAPASPREADKLFVAENEAAMLARGAEPGTVAIRTDNGKTYILAGTDPAAAASWREYDGDLPNAEPMPWNPVSTYLGARNLVRLLRAHATPAERRAFTRACLYEIPLELLAVLLDREGWVRLGRWGYRDAARELIVGGRLLALPGLAWRAGHSRRGQQFAAYVRGLIDGVFDRPLPLHRLGLR